MELQEQYNKMAEHLAGMKERCVDDKDSGEFATCTYDDGNGSRCAVGALIPDGHLGLEYDGDVTQLLEEHDDLGEFIDEELGAAFQHLHDDSHHWDENGITNLQYWLDNIANRFTLTTYRGNNEAIHNNNTDGEK